MAIIRPISDLRNHFNQISEICHKDGEPVFITKNGLGDLVVMSLASYERQTALLEIYQKLGEAEAESFTGSAGIAHQDLMKQLRARTREK
ncbi:MAG: type II toxin-antitoxin system prevent-host-death family antitoxin [bacterium]